MKFKKLVFLFLSPPPSSDVWCCLAGGCTNLHVNSVNCVNVISEEPGTCCNRFTMLRSEVICENVMCITSNQNSVENICMEILVIVMLCDFQEYGSKCCDLLGMEYISVF